eukprot:CAMPEP_0179360734 /NCGR_PEP_ID=MMETSP0797-20121207/80132_1 /TAXON_ID=47934 /ORGANISM="Dinophysis acuminata, Strain DAEP01" /LENGTH=79 /DNA_ID=CAMNT_0021076103 /DNA_START=194 /DNA_END=433 /DNA_ORIENTATION=-
MTASCDEPPDHLAVATNLPYHSPASAAAKSMGTSMLWPGLAGTSRQGIRSGAPPVATSRESCARCVAPRSGANDGSAHI